VKPFITIAMFVALALLAGMTLANSTDERILTCDPIEYPDGEHGVAVVTIQLTGNPVVTVNYYGVDRIEFLGRYEDHTGGNVPYDEEQAREYAFNHYFDRHG